ncbi:MAG: RNA polymerase subunit sigma-54 [Aquificaceae bacterium]
MKRVKVQTGLRLKPSLLLRVEGALELLTKTTEELLQEIETKHEAKITFRFKPPWFQEDYQEPQGVYIQSELQRVREQVRYEFDHLDLDIAYEIIDQLDHRGFFVGDTKAIAQAYGVSQDYVEDIRDFIKREVEPLGVACKSLEEFLLLQVEELYGKDEELFREVKEFLKGKNKSQRAREVLSRLKLSPFEGEATLYKGGRVDVLFEYDNHQWYVFVMDDFWDVEEKSLAFILELRRRVLRLVGDMIVERQEDFLLGRGPLKTLTLSQVAQRAGVSLSTLSRLVSRKYAKTPTGIYPLRLFFQRNTKDGYSKEEILRALKEILQGEGKGKSDREISLMLQKRGIKIARRTVNKYRNMLEGKP